MSCTRYVAHPIASVVVVLLAALALPASAGIITLGDVSPDPTGGVVGVLGIGNAGAGSVAVDGGSSLTAEKLTMGGGPNGTGSLSVSGAGSSTLVTFLNGGNIDVGSQGTGSLSVLAGGSFTYGVRLFFACLPAAAWLVDVHLLALATVILLLLYRQFDRRP